MKDRIWFAITLAGALVCALPSRAMAQPHPDALVLDGVPIPAVVNVAAGQSRPAYSLDRCTRHLTSVTPTKERQQNQHLENRAAGRASMDSDRQPFCRRRFSIHLPAQSPSRTLARPVVPSPAF